MRTESAWPACTIGPWFLDGDGMDHWPKEATPALARLAAAGRLILWGDSAGAKSLFRNSPRPLAGEGPGVRAAGTATTSSSFSGIRHAKTPQELVSLIDRLVPPDVTLQPASENIRYRHVIKGNRHFYIFFNEEATAVNTVIRLATAGNRQWLDLFIGDSTDAEAERTVTFAPHELKVLCVSENFIRQRSIQCPIAVGSVPPRRRLCASPLGPVASSCFTNDPPGAHRNVSSMGRILRVSENG